MKTLPIARGLIGPSITSRIRRTQRDIDRADLRIAQLNNQLITESTRQHRRRSLLVRLQTLDRPGGAN